MLPASTSDNPPPRPPADAVTPPHTPTPNLSSASPDTPSKRDTPHVVQTPRMKGYSRIGVGVKPDIDTTPVRQPVLLPKQDASASEKNEGLGYGIELDQFELRDLEMDRGEGSSSSSTREIILTQDQKTSERPTIERSELETAPVGTSAQADREIELPEMTEMKRIEGRLASQGEDAADRDELVAMVKTLLVPCLEQVPFMREQLDAQKATIQTLQERMRLSTKLTEIERDRHAAERAGWHRQMKAMITAQEADIAAGKRPRKGLDLDVGYHQELEAANKRLEMDNRLMAPRLADTQKQIDKLVTELRHLRSNVILSTSVAGPSTAPVPVHNEDRRREPGSPSKAVFNATTMGDARSEHLLLAARKVRTMRAQNANVGMLTLDELKRHGVVGPTGGIGYSEGYGGVLEVSSEDDESDEDEDRKPFGADEQYRRRSSVSHRPGGGARGKSQSVTNTPLLPRAKKSGKKNLPPVPTTPRGQKSSVTGPPPTTTPGGSNFTDLLRAAEMATRPQTPSRTAQEAREPMSAMSATRTRMRDESGSERGSPVKKARKVLAGDDHAQDRDASALDLLAQASQLDVAQGHTSENEQPPPPSLLASGPAHLNTGNNQDGPSKAPSSGGLEPAIDLHTSATPRTTTQPLDSDAQATFVPPPPPQTPREPMVTPQSRPRQLSNASDIQGQMQTPAQRLVYPRESPSPYDDGQTPHGPAQPFTPATDPPPGAFASPTGATVPGLGKYVHLSSSMPARRVRSPYLKWTVEEDELLARAVAIHGEKWDLVSKGVPTRSYHQVRQRWLRKTGAFDKKQPGTTTPADHHGMSGLAAFDDDREGSPTPQSGRTKKRKEATEAENREGTMG